MVPISIDPESVPSAGDGRRCAPLTFAIGEAYSTYVHVSTRWGGTWLELQKHASGRQAPLGIVDSLYTPFSGPGGEHIDEGALRTLVTHCLGALDHDGIWVGGLVGKRGR